MKKQTGFTLIELLVVITIVGILAASALPRFIDVGTDARIASIRSLEGSAASTINMLNAAARMRNAMSGTVAVEGVPVALVDGFPADAGELVKAMAISTDYVVSGSSIRLASAPDPATCMIAYAGGIVSRSTGGC